MSYTPRAIALLEIKLWLPDLTRTHVRAALMSLVASGFAHCGSYVLDEHGQFPLTLTTADEMLESGAWARCTALGWNLEGRLANRRVQLSLGVEPTIPMISLSTSEAPLLDDDRQRARAFLRALMSCCASTLAGLPTPRWANVGTEGDGPLDDGDLECVSRALPPFDAVDFFSQTNQDELLAWYATTYTHRWDR